MFPKTLQVAEGLIDGIVFHMMNRKPQDAGHPPAHGSIEWHVGGEENHLMLLHDVLHLEDRVTPMQPHSLCFGSECHDAAIVA